MLSILFVVSITDTYPHVHISHMHFSLGFLSDTVDDLMAKSSFTTDALDVDVDVTLVFMLAEVLFCFPTVGLEQIQREYQSLFKLLCLNHTGGHTHF